MKIMDPLLVLVCETYLKRGKMDKITCEEFTDSLARDGFNQVVTVTREPAGFLDTHEHPFEAKALVIQGELRIKTGDADQLFRVGDIFHLPAGMPHTEHYGPKGVTYLVGRK